MRPGYLAILLVYCIAGAAALSGCTRAGGAASVPEETKLRSKADAIADQIERFRRRGDFVAYTAEAEFASQRYPNEPRLRAIAAEALLAVGNAAAAETVALEAERLAGPGAEDASATAIKLWATARLRQGLPLETAQLARIALDDSALQTVLAWSDLLAGAPPFLFLNRQAPGVEVKLSNAPSDSLAAALLAVEVTANRVRCSRVFVDTGAQHTVITRAAAEAAGVRTSSSVMELAGFAPSTAEAGILDALEFGTLIIRNVPVLVADSPALIGAEGSMSLGTDLLYHLRVTLDYPQRRVTVAPAFNQAGVPRAGDPATEIEASAWRIPLWTFSRLPLAAARDAESAPLRVLIDTGDRRGTYISYRWARRTLPQLAGVQSGLVFRFKKRDLTLPLVELGTRWLSEWPVVDTFPAELDRLDAVDVMLGHDLLERYRLTIDLAGRELRLAAGDTNALENPVRPARGRGNHDLP